jgi:hypothetical protein
MNLLNVVFVWVLFIHAIIITLLTILVVWAGDYYFALMVSLPCILLWWGTLSLSNIEIGKRLREWIGKCCKKSTKGSHA